MEIWPAILEVWRNWDICSSKQFIGRKPNTQFSITPEGRKAFAEHIRALEDFLKNQKL